MASQRGFTLIELLVVVLLVAIVFTTAVSLVPARGRDRLEADLQRLQVLYQRAGERAVLEAVPYGLGFWDGGYRFFRLSADWQWFPVLEAGALRPRQWQAEQWPELYLDGIKVLLPAKESAARPQVYLFPDGRRSAFDLRLHSDLDRYHALVVDAQGQLTLGAL